MHKNLTFILGLVFVLLVLYCILNYEHFGGDVTSATFSKTQADKMMADKAAIDQKMMVDNTAMDKKMMAEKVAMDEKMKAIADKAVMDEKMKTATVVTQVSKPAKEGRKIYLSEIIQNEIERNPQGLLNLTKQLVELLDVTVNSTSDFITSVIDLSEKSSNIQSNIIKSIPITQKNQSSLAASKNAINKLKKSANEMKGKIAVIKYAVSEGITQARNEIQKAETK